MRSKLPTLAALAVAMGFPVPAVGQTAPLAGSEWRPTEIAGVEIAEDTEIFVSFEDGEVTGNGGCNQFFGSYKIEGGAIAFGPIASTKMLCPDPVQQNEDHLFEVLSQIAGFRRDGTELELTAEAGEPLVRLVQTDAD
jgi:heat shock protein HslJ